MKRGTSTAEEPETEALLGARAENPAEIVRGIGTRAESTTEINERSGADAEVVHEIGGSRGVPESGSESADVSSEIDSSNGFSRYRDLVTANLGLLASTWLSLHKQYQATILRAHHGSPALEPILTSAARDTKLVRESMGKELTKAIRGHVLYSWLKDARCATGVHVVRLIAIIGDPLRFPGRKCNEGHHLPVDCTEPVCLVPIGEKGMKISDMTPCGALVGDVRRGTGVRSLWHYLGLHVDENGRSPQKRKGQQATWSPIGRSCVLQPEGIADQIVRHNKEPWRGLYDRTKERLRAERGVVDASSEDDKTNGDSALQRDAARSGEIGKSHGVPERGVVEGTPENEERHDHSALQENGGTETSSEIEVVAGTAESSDAVTGREIESPAGIAQPAGGEAVEGGVIVAESGPLRPFQIDRLARKIAVKAFVGDMLVEWKRRVR